MSELLCAICASLIDSASLFSEVATFWITSPFALRMFGVMSFAISFFALRFVAKKESRVASSGLIASTMCLGVLPFLMVMARPEIIIFLLLLLICILSLTYDVKSTFKIDGLVRLVLTLFLVSLMLWIHPGSIAFFLIVAICLCRLSPNRAATFFLAFIVLYLAFTAVSFHSQAYQCPAVAEIQDFFDTYSGKFGAVEKHSKIDLIKNRLSAALNFLPYVRAVFPISQYTSGMIPWINSDSGILQNITIAFVIASLLTLSIITLLNFKLIFLNLCRLKKIGFREQLGIAVALSIVFTSSLYLTKYPYRAVTFYLLLTLGNILILNSTQLNGKIFNALLKIYAAFTKISALCILFIYSIPVLSTIGEVVPVNQINSVGVFSADRVRNDIEFAIEKCGVNRENADLYLVDGITFFALKESSNLSLVSYATTGFPFDLSIYDYLRGVGAHGMFAMCDSAAMFNGTENIAGFYKDVVSNHKGVCCWRNRFEN